VGDVIRLCDAVPVDPVLKKGDLVKLVDMDEFTDTSEDEETEGSFEHLESATGVITNICMMLPLDHEHAPGQAMYVDVALPFDDGWEILEDVSIRHVHRILGDDSNEIRGYVGGEM